MGFQQVWSGFLPGIDGEVRLMVDGDEPIRCEVYSLTTPDLLGECVAHWREVAIDVVVGPLLIQELIAHPVGKQRPGPRPLVEAK